MNWFVYPGKVGIVLEFVKFSHIHYLQVPVTSALCVDMVDILSIFWSGFVITMNALLAVVVTALTKWIVYSDDKMILVLYVILMFQKL